MIQSAVSAKVWNFKHVSDVIHVTVNLGEPKSPAEMQEEHNSSIVLFHHYYGDIHVNEENPAQSNFNGEAQHGIGHPCSTMNRDLFLLHIASVKCYGLNIKVSEPLGYVVREVVMDETMLFVRVWYRTNTHCPSPTFRYVTTMIAIPLRFTASLIFFQGPQVFFFLLWFFWEAGTGVVFLALVSICIEPSRPLRTKSVHAGGGGGK